jgi:hypothetical protein
VTNREKTQGAANQVRACADPAVLNVQPFLTRLTTRRALLVRRPLASTARPSPRPPAPRSSPSPPPRPSPARTLATGPASAAPTALPTLWLPTRPAPTSLSPPTGFQRGAASSPLS